MSRYRRFLRGRNAGQVQLPSWSGSRRQQGRKDCAPPAESARGEPHAGGRGLQFQHFQRSGCPDVHQLQDRGLYGCPAEAEWYAYTDTHIHTYTHTHTHALCCEVWLHKCSKAFCAVWDVVSSSESPVNGLQPSSWQTGALRFQTYKRVYRQILQCHLVFQALMCTVVQIQELPGCQRELPEVLGCRLGALR